MKPAWLTFHGEPTLEATAQTLGTSLYTFQHWEMEGKW